MTYIATLKGTGINSGRKSTETAPKSCAIRNIYISFFFCYLYLISLLQEGAEILEANGGVVDGTRSETKKIEDAIKASEDDKVDEAAEPETNGNCEETAKLKRKSTMVATAEVRDP